MLERIFAELGPWNWMVLGFVLLTLEILVPGVFLLWIGIAALIVGALSLMLWDAGVLELGSAGRGVPGAVAGLRLSPARRSWAGAATTPTSRCSTGAATQLVGRTATLTEPITDGRGRIKLGDTMWRVSGPDLPVGTHGARQVCGGPRSGTGGGGGVAGSSPVRGRARMPTPRRS